MRKIIASLLLAAAAAGTAHAALDVGDPAPDFTLQAALGGKVFQYRLAEALAKGPVVLYFFPAAFSEGCSLEAHQFAEATDRFAALGASVIGVSADELDVITKFSVQACQGRFPVAADERRSVIKAYDAAMQTRPEYATRVSYVIAPGGKVVYAYLSLNPHKHVQNTLAAVAQWRRESAPR